MKMNDQFHSKTKFALFLQLQKGYQSRDNTKCWAHGKWTSKDPGKVPNGCKESSGIKHVGIVLWAVDGYGANKKKIRIISITLESEQSNTPEDSLVNKS